MSDEMKEALQEAVRKARGQTGLARICDAAAEARDIRQGHVWGWLHKQGRLPAEFCLVVEEATGISRHRLRPDIFGPESLTKLDNSAKAELNEPDTGGSPTTQNRPR